MLIEIQMIQEMAITASLGVAVIILTNLVLVPVLLSYVHSSSTRSTTAKLKRRHGHMDPLWNGGSRGRRARTPRSIIAVARAVRRSARGRPQIKIGDLHAGVPELRADSRYNIDTDVITEPASPSASTCITVIVESRRPRAAPTTTS
jgi:uncharacterized protein